jgi:hypothetical protein
LAEIRTVASITAIVRNSAKAVIRLTLFRCLQSIYSEHWRAAGFGYLSRKNIHQDKYCFLIPPTVPLHRQWLFKQWG